MTSVSFLHVSVEEQPQAEEDDLSELTSAANLFSQVANLSDYMSSQREEKKSSRKKIRQDPRVCKIHLYMSTIKDLQPTVPVLKAGHQSVLFILCLIFCLQV